MRSKLDFCPCHCLWYPFWLAWTEWICQILIATRCQGIMLIYFIKDHASLASATTMGTTWPQDPFGFSSNNDVKGLLNKNIISVSLKSLKALQISENFQECGIALIYSFYMDRQSQGFKLGSFSNNSPHFMSQGAKITPLEECNNFNVSFKNWRGNFRKGW